jgi:predicted DsbA family dithiol-disulfide isomerase
VEPVINEKDWPHTLENIKEYLSSQYGGTWATFDAIRAETAVTPEADDPAEHYDMVDQEITTHAPHFGINFENERRKDWDIMSNVQHLQQLFFLCLYQSCAAN